jgi:hypothetical protein
MTVAKRVDRVQSCGGREGRGRCLGAMQEPDFRGPRETELRPLRYLVGSGRPGGQQLLHYRAKSARVVGVADAKR